jgi:transcriptional regulator with XRE-family HTH domain
MPFGMNQMLRIRRNVFRVTQIEMAQIAGVKQPTISRWERGLRDPDLSHLQRIRAEARRRKLRWDDGWFFSAEGRAA